MTNTINAAKEIDRFWASVAAYSKLGAGYITKQVRPKIPVHWLLYKAAKLGADQRNELGTIIAAAVHSISIPKAAKLSEAVWQVFDSLPENSGDWLEAVGIAEEAAGRCIGENGEIVIRAAVTEEEAAEKTEAAVTAKVHSNGWSLAQYPRLKTPKTPAEEHQVIIETSQWLNEMPVSYKPNKADANRIFALMQDASFIVLTGPPGCGKSSLVELLAKVGDGRPFHRVQCFEAMTDSHLLGTWKITPESRPTGRFALYLAAKRALEEATRAGDETRAKVARERLDAHCDAGIPPLPEYESFSSMAWQYGPVINAMLDGVDRETGEVIPGSKGAVLLIDEFDAPLAGTMLCLQGLLERPLATNAGRRRLVLAEKGGEVILAHPGLTIVMTGNTHGHGDSTGRFARHRQDAALLNRADAVIPMSQPAISPIISGLVEPDLERKLVALWDDLQMLVVRGDLHVEFSVRQVIALIRNMYLYGKFWDAVRDTLLNRVGSEGTPEYQMVLQAIEAHFPRDYQLVVPTA